MDTVNSRNTIVVIIGLAVILMVAALALAQNQGQFRNFSVGTGEVGELQPTNANGALTATSTASATSTTATSSQATSSSQSQPTSRSGNETRTSVTIPAGNNPIVQNSLRSNTLQAPVNANPISSQNISTQTGVYYVFVSPDNYYKVPGSTVVFRGSHFYPNEIVSIYTGGQIIATIPADSTGRFTTSAMSIPFESGRKNYVFVGGTSNIPFPVGLTIGPATPWIVLSSYYAGQGSPLVITGKAFGSSEQVRITYNNMLLGTTWTDGQGSFTFQATIPPHGSGQKVIEAVGLSTGVTDSESFSQAY